MFTHAAALAGLRKPRLEPPIGRPNRPPPIKPTSVHADALATSSRWATATSRHAEIRGRADVTVETEQRDVAIPTPCGGEVLVDPRHHREHVVRRLLADGVRTSTLLRLLPEWEPLIARVAAEHAEGP
jgi:hypothetical protein